MVTISAISKLRIGRVLQLLLEVHQKTQIRIATAMLNDYLLPIIENSPPPVKENKMVKTKYCAQVSTRPTTFVFHCNFPEAVAESYKRFLERKIREEYDFTGVPFKMKFVKK